MTANGVDVLWTSGWDSTFRVVDLLLNEQRIVQPWYVLDSGRPSTKKELATMDRIRQTLIEIDPTVEQRLPPTRTHRIEDIPPDEAITRRWQLLLSRSHLGSQYDWLARLAAAHDVTLELSIHRDDKAHSFLKNFVELGPGSTYSLSPDIDDDALEIFRRFSFPLFNYSKIDMAEKADTGGFGEVMEMTWFCYRPMLDGKPCGFCNPCRYTREEGLGRRVPKATLVRKLQYGALNRAQVVGRLLAR